MLRPYQQEAVNKMVWFTEQGLTGGVVVAPTGSGKSHIIAAYAEKYKPLLILVPNREILEQDMQKLSKVVDEIGVFSASMGSKTVKTYTIGTIQSVYKHPKLFKQFKHVIVDEVHLIHPTKYTMYKKLFDELNATVIGLTATPYRLDTISKRWGDMKWQVDHISTIKMITRYYNGLFRYMLYVINPKDLIKQGYLRKPEYYTISSVPRHMFRANKSKTDYDTKYAGELLERVIQDIAFRINNAPVNSAIVYCPSIEFAERLQRLVHNSMVVTSKTNKTDRKTAVERLRNGTLRVLINVSVLTLGFDYPDLESIFILRPTRSLVLHMQMIGRLTRPSKNRAVVFDFVGNVDDLGKIEDISVEKRGKWNVFSPAYPDGFHGKELYTFTGFKPKKKEENQYVF